MLKPPWRASWADGSLDRLADQALVGAAALSRAGLDGVEKWLRGAALRRSVLGSASQVSGLKAAKSR